MNEEQFAYQQEMQTRLSGLGARHVRSHADTRTLETTFQMAETDTRALLNNGGFAPNQIETTSGTHAGETRVKITLDELVPLNESDESDESE